MKTANTTPRPATVTNPPLCDRRDGAPAVVALTVPAEVEVEFILPVADPVADALPLDEAVDFVVFVAPLVAVEDILAVALPAAVPVVDADFDALVLEDD